MHANTFLGSALVASSTRGHRQAGGRTPQVTTCVATPSKPPTTSPPKRSAVEIIKENSDFLRHPLMEGRCH